MQPVACLARPRAIAAAVSLLCAPLANASCGAAFCNLLNDRFALGTWDLLGACHAAASLVAGWTHSF